MNIFGIGGAELVVIFLIMIIVAGPKRMIQWAYILGVYVGKARQMWTQVVDVMQSEIDAAGVDIQLPKQPPTRQNMSKMLTDAIKPMTQPVEDTWRETKQIAEEAKPTAKITSPKPKSDTPITPKTPTTSNEAFGSWGSNNNPTPSNSANFGSWSSSSDKEA
jgi:Sec-independent protein translocase protein TatA